MAWSGLLRWIERPLGVYFTFKWRARIGVPLPRIPQKQNPFPSTHANSFFFVFCKYWGTTGDQVGKSKPCAAFTKIFMAWRVDTPSVGVGKWVVFSGRWGKVELPTGLCTWIGSVALLQFLLFLFMTRMSEVFDICWLLFRLWMWALQRHADEVGVASSGSNRSICILIPFCWESQYE